MTFGDAMLLADNLHEFINRPAPEPTPEPTPEPPLEPKTE